MPGRFQNNLCPNCGNFSETTQHRYLFCSFTSDIWGWIWSLCVMLDQSLILTGEESLLRLNFLKGLRENAILWILGIYIELVECEVILKQRKLDLSYVKGYIKQKKQTSHLDGIPELGLIPYIDWDVVGVG